MSRNLVSRPTANTSQSEEWKQPSPNKAKKPIQAVDSPAHNDSDHAKEPGSNLTSDVEENIFLFDKSDEMNVSYSSFSTCDENMGSATENDSAATTNEEANPVSSASASLMEAHLNSVIEMKKRFTKANQIVEKAIGKTPLRRRKRNKFRLTLKKKTHKYVHPKVKQQIKNSFSDVEPGEMAERSTILDTTGTVEGQHPNQSEDFVKACADSFGTVNASLDEVNMSNINSTKNLTSTDASETCTDIVSKSAYVNSHPVLKTQTENSTCIEQSSDPVVKRPALRKPKTCKSTEILSHYQILKKCLSQKRLYHVLQIGPKMYRCPLCSYQNAFGQYVLLHLRRHRDLTAIFELYQNAGAVFKDEASSPELPEPKSFLTNNSKNDSEEFVVQPLLINKIAPVSGEKTSDGTLVKKKKTVTTKKVANCRLLAKRGKKVCITKKRTEDSASSNLVNPLPECSETVTDSSVVNVDHAPLPTDGISTSAAVACSEKPMTKRKLPCKAGPIKKRCAGIKISKQPPSSNNNNTIFKKTSPLFGVSYRESLDPELAIILKQEIRRKVSPDNPHACKFCGKLFYKGTGIYSHYFKHARKPVNKKNTLKKQSEKIQHSSSALNSLVSNANASDEKELKAVRNKDYVSFQKLEKNVNQLLKVLVGDVEILTDLGWPERNVSDLVIDILERCKLQPAYRGSSKLSKLECLRKNVNELFKFCIKDSAMEEYGWNNKLVDEVVQEMLISENCKPA